MDLESGFSFFGRRYYSPTVGRFLTPDPIGFADGPNLYAYVHNSPLILVDPYGLFAINPPSVTDPWGHNSFSFGEQSSQPSDFPNYGSTSSDNTNSSLSPIGITGSSSDGGGISSSQNQLDDCSIENDKYEEFAHRCGFDSKAEMDRFIAERFYQNPSVKQLLIDLILTCFPLEKYLVPVAKEGMIFLKESIGSTRSEVSCAKQVLLNPPIQITEKAMKHIIDRHVSNDLPRFCDRSKFNAGENLFELIQRGIQQPMIPQENGRFVRSFDVGRSISVDYFSGTQSSILSIVTERDGTLVTMFPGPPK